ncbi:MAG: sel1 repeat family protein [Synergistaceae bacterium]|nr:sel1 repeat family protein [Synergistaceae bacterium]
MMVLDATADQGEKALRAAIRMKIGYYAVWFIPFTISMFSERQYLDPGSRFFRHIAGDTTFGATVVFALVLLLAFKALDGKSPYRFFWYALGFNGLLTAIFVTIIQGNYIQYTYARYALFGEERILYRALFWLPLFKIFHVTPGLDVLLWTEKIFSQWTVPIIFPMVFSCEAQQRRASKKSESNGFSSRKHWKTLLFVGVLGAFFISYNSEALRAFFTYNPRFGIDTTPMPEQTSSLYDYDVEYRLTPDSEETAKAREMMEKGEYEAAIELLTSRSSVDSTAAVALAKIYRDGKIVEEDADRASFLFLRGARKGNLEGLSGYAQSYRERDRVRLLEFAVEKGDRDAYTMQMLGLYHSQGIITTGDYLKSAHFYQIAAEEGRLEGMWQTAGFLYRGYMMDEDLDRAMYWIGRIKQMGNPKDFYYQQAELLLKRIEKKKARRGSAIETVGDDQR